MKAKRLWATAAFLATLFVLTDASAAGTKLSLEGNLPSLDRTTAWFNSDPLRPADLRGKVVVVQFWTYTCINWRRTLPYVRAWANKYQDQGLVVIGVHTPEFSFEKNLGNIQRALEEQDVDYPVAVDSDYAIWRAFDNHYWPALYIVDAQGQIRRHHFGEGEYERSEMIIQQLLSEAGRNITDRSLVSINPSGAEAQADWKSLGTPETYLGYQQTNNFASPGSLKLDKAHSYSVPERLRLNHWALAGDWTARKEFVALNKPNGKVTYRFHARDVHLVMGSAATQAKPVRFRVLIDGRPPGDSHGVDVDAQGMGTLAGPRMYQLIRQHAPIADRQFEIEFLDAGAEVFAFTFG